MKITSKFFKVSALTAVLLGAIVPMAQAGRLSGKIDYQTYLDFAANRGAFKPGLTQIPITGIDGTVYGTITVPMVDWAATDPSGVASLVNPMYVVSAKHNKGYTTVRYGGEAYHLVDKNESWSDFHAPRLNKVVTEVAPYGMVEGVINHLKADTKYLQRGRYVSFFRAGSGTHEYLTYDANGKVTNTQLMGAYKLMTGGTMPTLTGYANGDYLNARTVAELFPSGNNFLPTHPRAGDSGSPVVAYDTVNKNWVIVGVTSTVTSVGSNYATINDWFVNKSILEDTDAPVAVNGGKATWVFDAQTGNGTITVGNASYEMHGQVGKDNGHGKHLTFNGGGLIELAQDVNQGAAALTFNGHYTVQSQAGQDASWVGGGLILGEGSHVTWKVKGQKGDVMHVIGNGTLVVQGQGINEGGLKVGQGTVILDQQKDAQGQRQAFSSLNINSGRATVILKSADQVDPDTIRWGFRGGTLDVNGFDLTFHKLNHADEGAILANHSSKRATVNLRFYKTAQSGLAFNTAVIYHGQMQGNLNISNYMDPGWTAPFALDGGFNIRGDFSQTYGTLLFQGHPEIHAYVSESVANKVQAIANQKVNTQPTNFDQSDWQTRLFNLGTLQLTGADFGLGRNAILTGDIEANRSKVTLGDDRVFVDKFDGSGNKQLYAQGRNQDLAIEDQALFQGSIKAWNQSQVNIKGRFFGNLDATDSTVTLNSNSIQFIDAKIAKSKFTVMDGSTIAVTHGLQVDQAVHLGDSTLSLSAMATQSALDYLPGYVPTVNAGYYDVPKLTLTGDKAHVEVGAYGVLKSDVVIDGRGRIDFNGQAHLRNATSAVDKATVAKLNGYAHAWRGAIVGDWGQASLQNTYWLVTGASNLEALDIRSSLVAFRDGTDTNEKTLWQHYDDRNKFTRQFSSLQVQKLHLENSKLYMRTNGDTFDQVRVTGALTGQNNTLYIDNIKPVEGPTWTDLTVLTTQGTLPENFIRGGTSTVGFTTITPDVEVQRVGQGSKVVVTGLTTRIDRGRAATSQDVVAIGYQGFVNEINNMNLRMGELRDNPYHTGAWARVTDAAGSSATSSNEWTAVQVGADRQVRAGATQVYVGGLATYTKSTTTGQAYSAEGNSYGLGVYASTLFDSGLYVDAIAKYIRSSTDYSLRYAGQHAQTLHNNTLYAGAEVGYRIQLRPSTFVEPQAELVYGHLGSQDFTWTDQTQTMTMHQKASNPLVGRTGVVLGQRFEGTHWKIDARLGAHYEWDIVATQSVLLDDGLTAHELQSERDGRFIYALGVNAEVSDQVRLGLEVQRSAGGRFDIGHLVNANLRYSF